MLSDEDPTAQRWASWQSKSWRKVPYRFAKSAEGGFCGGIQANILDVLFPGMKIYWGI